MDMGWVKKWQNKNCIFMIFDHGLLGRCGKFMVPLGSHDVTKGSAFCHAILIPSGYDIHSLPWKENPPFFSSANHLFLWIIYTMAMLNNHRYMLYTVLCWIVFTENPPKKHVFDSQFVASQPLVMFLGLWKTLSSHFQGTKLPPPNKLQKDTPDTHGPCHLRSCRRLAKTSALKNSKNHYI